MKTNWLSHYKMIMTLVLPCVLVLSTSTLKAQQNGATPPSDMASLPYVVQEMVQLISSSIEAPTDTNAYVQMVLQYGSFPTVQLGHALDQAQLHDVEIWVANHPQHIENLLIARKENYDIYYGQASGGASN